MVSMTSVTENIHPAAARILKLTSYACSLIFFGIMFGYGLFQTVYNWKQTSPAIGLIMSFPYAALPVGFLIMFFVTLEQFLGALGLCPRQDSQ